MEFIVHAFDKPDALPRRQKVIAAHRAFLNEAPARHGITVRLSGPLMDDAGARMIGSFFLLDAPSRATIEALFAEDPLADADVWGSYTITAVHIRQNTMSDR